MRNKSPQRNVWMPDIESPLKRPPEIFSMGAPSRAGSSPNVGQENYEEDGVYHTTETAPKNLSSRSLSVGLDDSDSHYSDGNKSNAPEI